jgi:Leucine rich repeat
MDSRIPGGAAYNRIFGPGLEQYQAELQARDTHLARQKQPEPAAPAEPHAGPARRKRHGPAAEKEQRPRSSHEDFKPLKAKNLPKPDVGTWARNGAGDEKREEAVDRVRTAKDRNSKDINLSQLELKNIHPDLLPSSTQHLSLAENKLGSLPSKVREMADLKTLEAQKNQIRSLPENIGSVLAKLTDLNLSNNQISVLPQGFGDLRSLLSLKLDHNRLQSLPDELALLDKLQVLSVSNNLLTGDNALPPRMHILSHLRELDLSVNQLTSLPSAWNDLFMTVRRVNLSKNNLIGLPESFVKPLKSLSINLADNALLKRLPRHYGGFTYASALMPFGLKPGLNDKIVGLQSKIKVNTANTQIRQGLVNEARLEKGRGINPQSFYDANEALPPNRVFNNALDDVYSVDEFMADQEPAHFEGLDRVGVPDLTTDEFGRAVNMAPGGNGLLGANPATEGNRMDGWLGQQADNYANRFNATPQPAPQAIPMGQFDLAWPQMQQQNMTMQPGYGSGAYGAMPLAAPPMNPQFLQALQDPQVLQALQNELSQLQYMDPAVQQQYAPLIAQIAALQSQQGFGAPGSYGAFPMGPTTHSTQGPAQFPGKMNPPPYADQQQPTHFSSAARVPVPDPTAYTTQRGEAGPSAAAGFQNHAASNTDVGERTASGPARPAPPKAEPSGVNTNWQPAAALAHVTSAAAWQAGSGVMGKLKATVNYFWRPADQYRAAESLSRMSMGESPAPHGRSTAPIDKSWPQNLNPPAPRPATTEKNKGLVGKITSAFENLE